MRGKREERVLMTSTLERRPDFVTETNIIGISFNWCKLGLASGLWRFGALSLSEVLNVFNLENSFNWMLSR